jgi:anti-sigma regulatory factor (Ser/Thr protein kinase)
MCSVTPDAAQLLPADKTAPSVARALLRRASCARHNGPVVESAQLLVSEVVTNALLHGMPPIRVSVSCIEKVGMQVRVSDGSTVVPVRRDPDVWSEFGRGLALLDLLSDTWGAEQSREGKEVWFRLNASTPHRPRRSAVGTVAVGISATDWLQGAAPPAVGVHKSNDAV